VKLPEGRSETSLTSGASFGKPPEVKLSEGSRRKRRTPFLREEAEGRPSFGRKPKDVLFSKQVRILRLPSESRHPARGEASRRKPKEAEGSEGRPSFGRKPKDVLFSKQVRFLRLPSESRHPARGEASRRKPKEAEGSEGRPSFGRKRRTPFLREEAEGRPSFGRKPKDVLFSKQVRFLRLPSESRQR